MDFGIPWLELYIRPGKKFVTLNLTEYTTTNLTSPRPKALLYATPFNSDFIYLGTLLTRDDWIQDFKVESYPSTELKDSNHTTLVYREDIEYPLKTTEQQQVLIMFQRAVDGGDFETADALQKRNPQLKSEFENILSTATANKYRDD